MADKDDEPDRYDPLARLARLNPTVVVFGAVALFLLVLFLPGAIGGALVLAIAIGLTVLLTRTWPVLPSSQRVLRVLVIALLAAVGLSRFL
jgi:hypothetical protein